MGEYFEYANHDKKLKFSIGLSKSSVKFSGIGYCHLSTRAFCLLLTKSDEYDTKRHALIGSWIGDCVSCIGDQTRWNNDYESYLDITANILVMLYKIDGDEQLIESASEYDGLFVQLAHLIFTQQLVDMLPAFKNRFGYNWKKKYKLILEQYSYYNVFGLVDIPK